jgi:hypothetical protein
LRWDDRPCEDVNPVPEEYRTLDAATKQRYHDLLGEVTNCVLKCPLNPIPNQNRVYSQSRDTTVTNST